MSESRAQAPDDTRVIGTGAQGADTVLYAQLLPNAPTAVIPPATAPGQSGDSSAAVTAALPTLDGPTNVSPASVPTGVVYGLERPLSKLTDEMAAVVRRLLNAALKKTDPDAMRITLNNDRNTALTVLVALFLVQIVASGLMRGFGSVMLLISLMFSAAAALLIVLPHLQQMFRGPDTLEALEKQVVVRAVEHLDRAAASDNDTVDLSQLAVQVADNAAVSYRQGRPVRLGFALLCTSFFFTVCAAAGTLLS